MIRLLTTEIDLQKYEYWVHAHPQGSLWQSLEWKRYQESLGRMVKIYIIEEAGIITASAMVSVDTTVLGFSTWDIPRGPLGLVTREFLEHIIRDAKADRCMTLYLSAPIQELSIYPVHIAPSSRCEQLEATRMIDLTESEEQILASMHQKGRYNIGVAKKHRVTITRGSAKDMNAFYDILKTTGSRDGFAISQKSHYARFLSDLDGSFIFLAKHEGKPVAGLIGVVWPPPNLSRSFEPLSPADAGERNRKNFLTGIYYYGASSYEHRHLMAPYLLQWEAMLHCKKAGCTRYDLLGIAPDNAKKNDPWLGITDFKRKFGGEVVTYPEEQMIVLRPAVKRLLEWKRKIVG